MLMGAAAVGLNCNWPDAAAADGVVEVARGACRVKRKGTGHALMHAAMWWLLGSGAMSDGLVTGASFPPGVGGWPAVCVADAPCKATQFATFAAAYAPDPGSITYAPHSGSHRCHKGLDMHPP